jgi:ribonuclease P/MRP protein subunit POP1
MLAGFKVYDPRLHFPPPALPEDSPASQTVDGVARSGLHTPSPDLASSSLWDANVREDILNPSHSKFDLDRRRHELALPGTRLRPLAQDDRIPLLLVVQNNSYSIMFPRGWSQPILHSITYTSTLLGGLEERRAMYREIGVPCFPEHYGEVCRAGKEWEGTVAKEDERRWTRKPPGKRIENPTWRAGWDKILGGSEEERMNDPGSSREHIWALPSILKDHAGKAQGAVNAFRSQRGMDSVEGLETTGIVHVTLEVEGRGSPGRMAQIYALTKEERTQWTESVDRGPDRVHEDIPPALKVCQEARVLSSRR